METMSNPPSIQPQAVKEIRRLMEEPGFDKNNFLRIGVKGGGCSGLSYILGFDKKQDQDQMFESNGLTFIMNPSHSIYLDRNANSLGRRIECTGFQF